MGGRFVQNALVRLVAHPIAVYALVVQLEVEVEKWERVLSLVQVQNAVRVIAQES